MTCHDFDRLLHPYVDGEFDPSEQLDAERHLATCPACTRKVDFERQFRAMLREKVAEAAETERIKAPPSLRMHVIQDIQREHRRRQTRALAQLATAAAVVAVAGGLTWAWWPKTRERYLLDAAQWHARSLPAEIHGGAHEEVEAWFGGKLDHRVPVPRFPNARVAGARLSNVQERPAAYIRYQKPDSAGTPRTIGLFVFGDSDHDVEARPLPSVELDTRLGYNVAIWRDGEIVYEMVTDLDERDIRALLEAQNPGASPRREAPAPARLPAESMEVRPASLQQ